jgi:PAS domain S-box-containing protein
MASSPGVFDRHEQIAALLVDSVVGYAIFVLDDQGHVRSWNPGAERLKGYTREEILGEHFSTFYTPDDRRDGLPARLLLQAEVHGQATHRGWRVRKDGTRFFGDITITAMRMPDGELLGFAKVTRDLTEQHETELAQRRVLERERAAARELERLGDLRSRFLAGISHDLGTPIAVILGSTEVLSDGDLDPQERSELVATIARNARQLHGMVGQLRELARLEAGALPLDRQPVSIRAAAEACVEDLAILLQGLQVEIEAEGHLQADPLALRRVLSNLLTNAAQHSPPGGRLRILAEDRGDQLAVGVADEGAGVAPGDAEHIFEAFRQGGSGGVRRSEGLGLGLSIVHQYVEQHGGQVWVESEPGAGATFWFTWPAAEG